MKSSGPVFRTFVDISLQKALSGYLFYLSKKKKKYLKNTLVTTILSDMKSELLSQMETRFLAIFQQHSTIVGGIPSTLVDGILQVSGVPAHAYWERR